MSFGKEFVWGAATAAYQIEGGWQADGKGTSIWDLFSHEPGKVYAGHTGDVACDHYHHCHEDVVLMKEIGLQAYRFSLSWPRILPDGRGRMNQAGVDFYHRLIDDLLENGIRPFVTLYHWDYPAALSVRGSWENPDSPFWFQEYAEVCARLFGDRVKDFITLNEPQIFLGHGYVNGVHAPGVRLELDRTVPMAHHILMAHGLAASALRAAYSDVRIGYAPCANPRLPATSSPEDIEAARQAYFSIPAQGCWCFNVPWWSDPVLLGHYPECGLERFAAWLPPHWEKDMSTIFQKPDFYGQNIYCGDVIRHREDGGYEEVALPVGAGHSLTRWPITPEALYWGPRFLYERYRTPIVITENGMSCHDTVSLDGCVHDPNRIDYLHRYLLAYRRAAEEGVELQGYFVWSLMDNYEWSRGYSERFGLIYVDYPTQRRILKDSAAWYRDVIATNGENL